MDILYFQAFFSPLFATVPNKYQGGEGGERKGEADKFGGGGDVGEGLGGGVWAVGFGGMLKDTIYVRERGVGGGDGLEFFVFCFLFFVFCFLFFVFCFVCCFALLTFFVP